MWSILNNIIKNESKQIDFPEYFIMKDQEEYHMDVVANSVNTFFVNVGPDLAAEINLDKLINKNPPPCSSKQ